MSSSFQKWQQEDAHDYLHSLLEDLDNCVLGTGHFIPCSFFQGGSFVSFVVVSEVKYVVCQNPVKIVAYHQVLDMEPFFSNHQQEKVEMKYELYSVLVHAGFFLNSGHITTLYALAMMIGMRWMIYR
ncbi:hypothetical protein SUGI_0111150 [Cryptomeria japonica]|nr:hypothetical protein SUGI_0111150 [Cryptomeria japonica]